MAIKKYDLDPELKMKNKGAMIVSPIYIPFSCLFNSLLKKPLDKNKINISYIKVNKTKIHIISPKKETIKKRPCLLYIHGGGFVYRATPGYYLGEQMFSLETDTVVIGLEYHLAPFHKYPYQLNECFDVYKFILDNADRLNIDINKIIIGGDSSGGLLTLETYLKILDNKVHAPNGLMLIYPVVDNKMDTISMKKYIDTPLWNAKCNKKMWKYYLKDNNYVSPLSRINDFKINNVYIELAEYDCLHDEGYNLYLWLKDKVNNLILNDTKRTFHGYDINFEAKVSIDANNKRLDFLRSTFEKA